MEAVRISCVSGRASCLRRLLCVQIHAVELCVHLKALKMPLDSDLKVGADVGAALLSDNVFETEVGPLPLGDRNDNGRDPLSTARMCRWESRVAVAMTHGVRDERDVEPRKRHALSE